MRHLRVAGRVAPENQTIFSLFLSTARPLLYNLLPMSYCPPLPPKCLRGRPKGFKNRPHAKKIGPDAEFRRTVD